MYKFVKKGNSLHSTFLIFLTIFQLFRNDVEIDLQTCPTLRQAGLG